LESEKEFEIETNLVSEFKLVVKFEFGLLVKFETDSELFELVIETDSKLFELVFWVCSKLFKSVIETEKEFGLFDLLIDLFNVFEVLLKSDSWILFVKFKSVSITQLVLQYFELKDMSLEEKSISGLWVSSHSRPRIQLYIGRLVT